MKLTTPYLLKEIPFNDLEGKKLTKTEKNEANEIVLYTNKNERYILKTGNYQNTDITGDFNDLLDSPIIHSRLAHPHPNYKDLMGNLRIDTTTSSVFIKWYYDYEDVKKRMEEISQEG